MADSLLENIKGFAGNIGNGISNAYNGVVNYNAIPTNQYGQLTTQLNNLQHNMPTGFTGSPVLAAELDNLNQGINFYNQAAAYSGVSDPNKLTGQQLANFQNYQNANTGFMGFVNNELGGVGNVVGIGKGILDSILAFNAYNTAKDQAEASINLMNNQIGVIRETLQDQRNAYDTRRIDIKRARNYTETGSVGNPEEDARNEGSLLGDRKEKK